MLRISERQSVAHTLLDVDCPHCINVVTLTLSDFIKAINQYELIECVACKDKFTISLLRQTRAAELRDGADRAGAGESRMIYCCPKCKEPRMRYDYFVQDCLKCGDAAFVIMEAW